MLSSLRIGIFLAAALSLPIANALTYEIKPGSDIVGSVQHYTVEKGDTFSGIARKFDLGFVELQEANPKINAHKNLAVGTELLIPTEFILPSGVAHEGIILNLAEMRLYYFPPNTHQVMTFPVGIGRVGWKTPTGQTTITAKRENPVWIPPASIHAEAARNGKRLASVYPAGPNNPLGKYALNLGWSGYRFHGTNAPASIGTRASHGCIRMFPEDIESLFKQVEVGTPVTVVHEPFKIGIKDGQLYLEAHQPFTETYYTEGADHDDMIHEVMSESNATENKSVNWSEVKTLIHETYGYPVKITNVPGA